MGNVLGGAGDDVLRGVCCDVKLVIVASKHLEAVLEKDFGGSGRGLHEKISSSSGEIPADVKRKLRKIATIRNKLIHELGYDAVDQPEQFRADFHSAIAALRDIAKARGSPDPFAYLLSACVLQ